MNDVNELERYLEYRQISQKLHGLLLNQLPQKAMQHCGKDLGFWVDKQLVVRDEADLAIICDYALFNYRKNGRTVIEHHLVQATNELRAEVRQILEADIQSRFTILQVENVVPNLGVNVQDILYHDSFFLTDRNLGNSGFPGMVVAARIISLPGCNMTSGALLTLYGNSLQGVMAFLSKHVYPRSVAEFTPEEKTRLQAAIIFLSVVHEVMAQQ